MSDAKQRFHVGVYVGKSDDGAHRFRVAVHDLAAVTREEIENAVDLTIKYARQVGHEVQGYWTRPHRPEDPECCP